MCKRIREDTIETSRLEVVVEGGAREGGCPGPEIGWRRQGPVSREPRRSKGRREE